MQGALNDAVAQAFPDRSPAELEARLSCGHPAQALIDESKEADLLVVGSSGHGAFTGMLLGSVSTHCVTSAFCTVTVVAAPRPATRRSDDYRVTQRLPRSSPPALMPMPVRRRA